MVFKIFNRIFYPIRDIYSSGCRPSYNCATKGKVGFAFDIDDAQYITY